MVDLKVGDIVARKSYGGDIYFKVTDIREEDGQRIILLRGLSYRIEADAPENDLVVVEDEKVTDYNSRMSSMISKKCRDIQMTGYAPRHRGGSKKSFYRSTSTDNARKFSRSGKILHIDGDNDYLETCLNQYRKFGLDVIGEHVPESEQPFKVFDLLHKHKPDILVLTGHDGVLKGNSNYSNIDSYRNSKYYVESVKEARRFQPDLDSLIIFAGACQSMYNAIIKAGANYASSPYRVLIHALDPVFVCQKVALAGIDKVLSPNAVIDNTITGMEGIGGIDTRGKYRNGFPLEPYNI
jgi:spore coat assemly protein